MTQKNNRDFYLINALITTAALTLIFWLLYFRADSSGEKQAVSMLPAINAGLNSLAAVLLIAGFVAIKKKREKLHQRLMTTALCVAAMFLMGYLYYHSLHGDTKFLGEGWIRPVYFFTLISHILLSIAMLPMILSTVYLGLTDQRKKHRKLARFTFPIWLYVSVTGVAIFFLLKNFS